MKQKNLIGFCAAAALLLGTGAANAETGTWTSGGTTVVLTSDSILTISALTINGTTENGAMEDYTLEDTSSEAPWYSSCTAIKTVIINAGVTSIGENAFEGCFGLTSISIPNSVTSIGENAFGYCSGLTSMTIPNSVTSIGRAAFEECSGLTSITIPNSVTSIGDKAFSVCSGLTSVTIPNSVTSIGFAAFQGCSGLTSITIPSSVTSIGFAAFLSCGRLTSVTIPNSVAIIDSEAFSNCRSLTAINVNAANAQYTSVGGVLYNKNQTTLLQYPAGKQGAFTIPNSVTTIGESAFEGCHGLTEIHEKSSTPPSIDTTTFRDVNTTTYMLYVPKGALEAYKTADGWRDFSNIIEEEQPQSPR